MSHDKNSTEVSVSLSNSPTIGNFESLIVYPKGEEPIPVALRGCGCIRFPSAPHTPVSHTPIRGFRSCVLTEDARGAVRI